jgi:hypothetical protein
MKRLLPLTIATGLILAFGLQISAKQSATAQMSKDPIRQGSAIEITITLDKAPNTDGRVYAELTPDGEQSAAASVQSGTAKGQTSVTLRGTLTLEAKLGKWHISKMQYFPATAQQGTDLALSGDLTFQVAPHEDITIPSGAKVIQIR